MPPRQTDKPAAPARKKKAPAKKKTAAPKNGDRKRKDKDAAAKEPAGEEDADEIVIEEDPYATKEELEALEQQLGSADLIKQNAIASREPAACLGLPLLPYQKEFLAWGIDQELGAIRGGILADEMGMGKTLQAVSLIVTHPCDGVILGPDSSPAAVAAPVTVTAPKIKLKLPASLPKAQPVTEDAAQRNPAVVSEHATPQGDMVERDATKLPAQANGDDVGASPSTLQSPLPSKPEADTASTPGPSVAQKKSGSAVKAGAKSNQEGSVSPESTKKGKAKGTKNKVDPLVAAMQQAKECYAEPENEGTDNFCGATLVVCPVVAAMQWQQEIIRYTSAGALNVVVYHGSNRNDNFNQDQLERADVVLTSYSVMEVDYRRNVMAPKATCKFCSKKFQPERLKVHLRYFCGPFAQKTEAQAKQQKKKAPWLVGGGGKGGSSPGDGKDGKGKGKGKGADGASTSKGASQKLADEEEDMIANDCEEFDAEDASEVEEDEGPVKKSKHQKGQGKKATGSKAKVKATAGGGNGRAKKVAAKEGKKVGKSSKGKGSKGASTRKPKGSKEAKAKPPASKRRKIAEPDAVGGGGDGSGSDDDSNFMQPDYSDTDPALAAKNATKGKADGKSVPQEDDASAAEVTRGKVTRARASKSAAVTIEASMDADVDILDAEELEDVPASGKQAVGSKRKRSKSDTKVAEKTTTKSKPRAAKGTAKGKKSKYEGSDSEGDSDWDPDSDDEQQQQADEVESSDDDEESVVDEEEVQGGVEEDAAVGEDEEEEDVLEEPETKKSIKKRKDEVEEELNRQVNEAAAKMIAAANKERATKPDGCSMLHEIRWRRVVLDEAHNIKDRRSNTAQAAFALTARYRWCLTGTPLQNRVTELYSLIRFLRLHPFAHYFADKTKCCSLDFPFQNDLRKCDLCQGSRMSHYCWWNRRVANPIKYNGYEGRGRTAMLILKHQILPKVLLRRTKLQCAADLALPPRTVVLRKDSFDVQEADFYEALYTQSQAAFGGYVDSGTVLNNYAHIFDLLIRLRQAVNHPYLVVYSASGIKSAPGAALGAAADTLAKASSSGGHCGKESDNLLGICGICHDPLEDGIGADCGHFFCRICVLEYLGSSEGAATCPTCKRPLTIDLRAPASTRYDETTASPGKENQAACTSSTAMTKFKKRSILSRINMASFQSSTKLEALREEIHNMLQHDPSAKCIVFSQFTSMLDLVQYRLSQVGVRCVKLEGSMSMDARQKTIKAFNEDSNVPCFLMSLKAGGVALNLTVASHVMLMDPWWNPAVEQQAQDRIHRLGQFKPINVTRFVIAGTIEERILKLQDKKQLVFEGTVGGDSQALGKLTVDDLRFLFG